MKKPQKHIPIFKKNFAQKMRFPLLVFTVLASSLFFIITSMIALYDRHFTNKVYPGIAIDHVSFSGKTKEEIREFFERKNDIFATSLFTFQYDDMIATATGKQLGLGFNANLIAEQAVSIGKSGNIFADMFNKGRAWFGEINLPASFTVDARLLEGQLAPIAETITIAPIDAVFEMKDNRVVNFRPSSDGRAIDIEETEAMILTRIPEILAGNAFAFEIALPVVKRKPAISLEDANSLGVKAHVGRGISHFAGSIPNRMHNIALAASRIDGIIVPTDNVFSFNDAVGDVSKLTGYKEAYIIKDGRTILGDGGGVCQVSTTLFRAVLAAGMPVVERHPHSYRVSYYEQDSSPGLDATVYSPTYDLKFKNDTGASMLIEAYADLTNATLIFDFYGTSDERKVTLSQPSIVNHIPAPEDRYQDDPTLPKGAVKQVDFKAAGATVVFSRTVEKNGNVLAAETFRSDYRPWQAVFLRGTME